MFYKPFKISLLGLFKEFLLTANNTFYGVVNAGDLVSFASADGAAHILQIINVIFNTTNKSATATIFIDKEIALKAANFFANISVTALLTQYSNFSVDNITVDYYRNFTVTSNETDVTNPTKPHIDVALIKLLNGAFFYVQGRSRFNATTVQADPNTTLVLGGGPSVNGNFSSPAQINITDVALVDKNDNFTHNGSINGQGSTLVVLGTFEHDGDNQTVQSGVDVTGTFIIRANNLTISGPFNLRSGANLSTFNKTHPEFFANLQSVDANAVITYQVNNINNLVSATIITYTASSQTKNFGGKVVIVDSQGNTEVLVIGHYSTRRLLTNSACSAQWGSSALTTSCTNNTTNNTNGNTGGSSSSSSSTGGNPGSSTGSNLSAASGVTIQLGSIVLLALIVLAFL